MGKGFSGTTVACLCAACFFVGCLIQQLPGLPDQGSGFRKSGVRRKATRRQAAEVFNETLTDALHLPNIARSHLVNPPAAKAKTVEDAVGHLLPKPLDAPGSGMRDHIVQPFQQLSWYPRMYVFPKFIDDERADHIVKLASKSLNPSALAYRKNDNPDDSKDVRTSSGTFLSRHQDPAGVLAWVEEKISALAHLPVGNGEAFNVLRYQLGQHYDSHYDVFNPEEYGPQKSNRMATVLFYLTDVEEGGETVFPFEGVNGLERKATINYKSCDVGFKYQPRKGDALLFYSIHPNGTFDPHALHGGCPVKKGEKMVMTKWIRDQTHTFY